MALSKCASMESARDGQRPLILLGWVPPLHDAEISRPGANVDDERVDEGV